MRVMRAKRNAGKIRWSKIFLTMAVMVAVVFAVLFFISDTASNNLAAKQKDPRPPTLDQEDFLSEEIIYSKNVLLIRLEDDRVLLDFNSDEEVYPASLTKMMTALVAIENIDDLEQKVWLDPELFPELYEKNASLAGFAPGEKVSARDLLYGCLLPSGAEASTGLAIYVSGSQEAFVELMNKKAKELGMSHTHFCNVTGLQDPDHYATMRDMATLLEYALQNKTFRKIFTTARYTTASTAKDVKELTFHSTVLARKDAVDFRGGGIIGGKTGYTGKAGLCLASLAKKYGREYILITAGAEGSPRTEPFHIQDALKIYGEYLLR